MRIKGKRVLKNGAIAGYVYYSKEKKWKWRIVGRAQRGGGHGSSKMTYADQTGLQEINYSNLPNNNEIINSQDKEIEYLKKIIKENLRKNITKQQKKKLGELKKRLFNLEINIAIEKLSSENEQDYLNKISIEVFDILKNKIDNSTKRKYEKLRSNRLENLINIRKMMKNIQNINTNNNNNPINNQINTENLLNDLKGNFSEENMQTLRNAFENHGN